MVKIELERSECIKLLALIQETLEINKACLDSGKGAYMDGKEVVDFFKIMEKIAKATDKKKAISDLV